MKKLDLVKYIALNAKKLANLQMGESNTVHQKGIVRKAAQEVLGISYNKALNFAVDVLSPIGDDLEKVAKRYKASELEALVKYLNSEILRVKSYIAKQAEEAATTEKPALKEGDKVTIRKGLYEGHTAVVIENKEWLIVGVETNLYKSLEIKIHEDWVELE